MDQLNLSDFFTTRPQAVDFSTRLSAVSDQVYSAGFNLESALLAQFGLSKKDKFMTLLRDQAVNHESNSSLQEFLTRVREKIAALSVVTLTLAFEPDEKILYELSEWFVLNINRQVLLDINVDPDLIAGAAVTFAGKFQDFSVKPKFNEILTGVLASLTSSPVPDGHQLAAPRTKHQSIEHISIMR